MAAPPNPQPTRPGILPATSQIVASSAYPHVPITPTEPNALDSGTQLPQADPNDPNQIPTISPERQNLSAALLKLAGTFIGNALEEGVGDRSGRVAKGIETFADAGVGLMKERWYKENASNFNNMVFKPFEKANQAAFQDYNQQLDQIMADPNIQPEEKFAAARALQYKLAMTGKNLSLQVQMAAANPQFASNPYIANTMATLLNHHEAVINDLSKAHDVALADDQARATTEAQRSATGAHLAQQQQAEAATEETRQKIEQTREWGDKEKQAELDLKRAQTVNLGAGGATKIRKALEEGDVSSLSDTDTDKLMGVVLTNDKDMAAIVKAKVEPFIAEKVTQLEDQGSEFQNKLQAELEAFAAASNTPLTSENMDKVKTAFFAQANPDKKSALYLYKRSPRAKMAYLAYLQHVGAGTEDALAPYSDAATNLGANNKGKLWESLLKQQTREGIEHLTKQGAVERAAWLAEMSGKPILKAHLLSDPKHNPDYVPPSEIIPQLQEVERTIQTSQQQLAAAKAAKDTKAVAMLTKALAHQQSVAEQLKETLDKSKSFEQ